MKSVSGALSSFLLSNPPQIVSADLYTWTLVNGTVLRYTDWQYDIAFGGHTWTALGPKITRKSLKWGIGLAVTQAQIEIADDGSTLIGSTPLFQAILQRQFDQATFRLDRIYAASLPPTWIGTEWMFTGIVGPISPLGRSLCGMTIDSITVLLNRKLPWKLFQPGCAWALYSTGCGVVKASFTDTGAVLSGGNAALIKFTNARATGFFDLGQIVFTSGANNGLVRTVKQHISGSPSQLIFPVPLPNTPGVGDTFSVSAGCDKTQSTCQNKFSNLPNFEGEPNIPVSETAI